MTEVTQRGKHIGVTVDGNKDKNEESFEDNFLSHDEREISSVGVKKSYTFSLDDKNNEKKSYRSNKMRIVKIEVTMDEKCHFKKKEDTAKRLCKEVNSIIKEEVKEQKEKYYGKK